MGIVFDFTCPSCDYEARLNLDGGFVVGNTPYVCDSCGELVHVITGWGLKADDSWKEKLADDFGRCPKCGSKSLTEWPDSRPCPRCGARMKERAVGKWD